MARIRPTDGVHNLIRKGQDVEHGILAHGLRYPLEGRVLTRSERTIVSD